MQWEKLGLIFVADKQYNWMQTHAAWPKALHIDSDIFRIFISVRDSEYRSHIAYVDIDLKNPHVIIDVSKSPVMSPGKVGLFDDCGVIPSCLAILPQGVALYYAGLSRSVTVPFKCFCGLSVLDINHNVATRVSLAPILDRTAEEPYSGGLAFVYFNNQRNIYQMWYEVCLDWNPLNKSTKPSFTLKYAFSSDGLHWQRSGDFCFPYLAGKNYISNPSVVVENNIYKMWYSFMDSNLYRIGYAESLDGMTWARKDDEVGISVSNDGWDSEEIEYPYVFDHAGERYMLYNGNGYGKTGFGLARFIND